MKPEIVYEKGLLFHHYANTAYPLTPNSFLQYRIKDKSEIADFLKSEFEKLEEISLYIHIPFCKQRCRFCEYTVLENTTEELEDEYVALLLKEMEMYAKLLKGKKIVGYDLGGGTPTKLSAENLKNITDALYTLFEFDENTVPSVETTPIIAKQEPEKISALYQLGYRRISMGIQTVSETLLNELGREGTTHIYEQAMKNIRNAGFERVNVDLMYGFLHQSDEDFAATIRYAISLAPEYVTLYRNRYKGTKIESESGGVSLYKVMRQYRLAYEILNENGYIANPGKNTFSKIIGDYGTSDYLTKRVINGTSYVGMGLGAQSFGMDYLAYNEGAASKKFEKYMEKIEAGEFPIQDIYRLPLEESIGKMVSVAFYFGFVDLVAFQKRFGISFKIHFKDEVEFVIKNGLMQELQDRLYVTERGADYINGIIPLFFSDNSKEELLGFAKRLHVKSDGEKEFLSAYQFSEYEKPSVTVDLVVLSECNDSENLEKEDCILLIKRGEHPFINYWALPGGFVKKNEEVEQAALRELFEETGVKNISMNLEGVFSEPNRDPRGWIISCAFSTKLENCNQMIRCGEDAIDARWVKINEIEKMDLAFDHYKIIKRVLERSKGKA